MDAEKAVAWLRQVIEAEKALAEEARYGDGRWWRRQSNYVDGTPYPVGALYEGDDSEDGSLDIVVYDEGRPDDDQYEHIALHDPRNTIADCEAKLAILDGHPEASDGPGRCARCQNWVYALPAPWPCTTIRMLASGYKHRPGYAEHWEQA